MKLRKVLIFMVALTMLATASLACDRDGNGSGTKPTYKVYYVDSDKGSDENNGLSEDSAWKTLRKVKSVELLPGETVKFKGEFIGDVLAVKGSGEADKRITITSYGDKKAVFDSKGKETTVYLYNQSHITIDNIEVKNTAEFYDLNTNNVKRNGIKIGGDTGVIGNITIQNSYIHEVYGTVVWNYGHHDNAGINIRYNKVTDKDNRFDNILLDNCVIEDIRGGGARIGDLSPGPKDTHINPYSTNIVFRRLVISRTGADGIIMQSTDSPLIEHVELYDAGYYGVFSKTSDDFDGTYSIAGLWACGSISPVIQYCTVARTRLFMYDAQPFNTDWGVTGTAVFQYNLSYDNEGGPLLRFTEPHTIFRYNVSINDDTNRGAFHHINRWEPGVSNPGGVLEAYNNIFYSDSDSPYYLMNDRNNTLPDRHDIYGKDVFRNNMFLLKTTNNLTFTANNIYNNNLYYGLSDNNITAPTGDTKAILSNPMLNIAFPIKAEDLTKDAFYLLPGSPAIGTGLSIENNGGKDYYGAAIDGSVNIGVSQTTKK